MELKLNKLGQESESTTEAKKMRLSNDASAMVFQIFTKNVYSNPIGTIVREITSNCFDSHVEANINLPVEIKLSFDNITKTDYISFIDYGVGMSPERIDNVYSVYFESTKRDTNNQIGGFGIGGKTPLAYKRNIGTSENDYDNSFYIITNYNGIKYTYTIYEGIDSPVVSLLDTQETIERNGTEVKIPVLKKDISKFASEIKRQLYYFENLIISGFDNYFYGNPNDYTIVKTNTFLFRGTDYSNNIHVCLGRVAYPIDYSALGISSSSYNYPIAIKLNVGDLNVTISREAIDYSEKTISFLKKKLNEVIDEIRELVNKQFDNVVTLEDYLREIDNFGTLYLTESHSFKVMNDIRFSDCNFKNFKYNTCKYLITSDNFEKLLTISRIGTKLTYKDKGIKLLSYNKLKSNKIYYINENDVMIKSSTKNKYIKKLHPINYLITFTPKSYIDMNNSSIACDLYDEYRELIKKYSTNYNEFIVPQSYLDYLKDERNIKRKLTNQFKIQFNSYIYYGDTISKSSTIFSELIKINGSIFYGTKDDSINLKYASRFFSTFFNDKYAIHSLCPVTFGYDYSTGNYHSITINSHPENILFIQVPKSQIKYFKHCKNAYHVNDFYMKMGRRKEELLTSYQEKSVITNAYYDIPSFLRDKKYSIIDSVIGAKINTVNEYINEINFNDSYALKTFINHYNINTTSSNKAKNILNLVNDITKYYNKFEKVLSYIDFPYEYHENQHFIDFIKKNLK